MLHPVKYTILVVEDESAYQHVYHIKLEKAGYNVITAGNGEEALLACDKKTPDLIILDLIMPVKDGFSTLEDMKKRPALKNVPVIVTSNLGQDEDIERAKKLGAIDYFVKSDLPVAEIPNIVSKHLK